MRRLIHAIKPRLMNVAFTLVYIAAFVVVYMDLFVWRPH